MDRKAIGIVSFERSPIEQMPPQRARALLAEAALQGGDMIFFAAADCHLDSGTVLASVWTPSGWDRQRVPLPRVVVVNDPTSPKDREVEAWLRARTHLIGGHGPDKLQQVSLLAQSPLAGYAIPTGVLTADNLETELTGWLSTHRGAVVKPIDGGRGSSIHFVLPLGDKWRLQRRGDSREGTLAEIVEALRASVAGRMRYRQFMIQRYIESSHAGAAAAVRIDVHKKPDGGWGVTRAAARLNIAGSRATNIAGGGAQMTIEKFLSCRTARPPDRIQEEAVAVACQIAGLIDRDPMASIVEVGVDLAIDAEDRLWFIEANVRPDAPWAEIDRARHIVAYALSLTN